jgi:hypothetical protein
MQPSITHTDHGWQLKGARSGGKEMLMCVFSFTNEGNEPMVKDLFSKIVYLGK